MRTRVLLTVLCATTMVTAWPAWATPAPVAGTITTIAGTGSTTGPVGDGGQATGAVLDTPSAVAVDAAGNTYVAEYWTSRVRKITPQGVITTFAGTGTYGSGPDGGPAAATMLKAPNGLAVDSRGDVYIADDLDSRVRMVNPSGVITTVAGNGSFGFGGDGGPAVTAALNEPTGLAVDTAGNLFIADTNNNRIRKVDANGTISTALGTGIAGNGSTQLNHPMGVAVNANGLYASDTGNNRVQEVPANPPAPGTIWTVAGYPGYPGRLNGPEGIALDPGGNLFIADTNNQRIVALTSAQTLRPQAGTAVSGFSGDGGQATVAQVNSPRAVAVDARSTLSIADTANNRIRRVTPGPLMTSVAGNGKQGYQGDGAPGDGGPATQAPLANVSGVVRDAAGNTYIGDAGHSKIRKVSPSGVISTLATLNGGDSAINGLAIDRQGNIYTAGYGAVDKIDPQGNHTVIAGKPGQFGSSGDGGPATQALLSSSDVSVAVDAAGNLYIADDLNYKIRKVDTNGIITTFAGTGVHGYSGDGGPATSAQLNTYYYSNVAVDAAGNVYVSDTSNYRIRKIAPNGIITTVAGTGTRNVVNPDGTQRNPEGVDATSYDLDGPAGLGVDPAGNIYFATISTIVEVGSDRRMHVLAGSPHQPGDQYWGCNGIGGQANLTAIAGDIFQFAVDDSGNVYAAEFDCAQIVKVARQ